MPLMQPISIADRANNRRFFSRHLRIVMKACFLAMLIAVALPACTGGGHSATGKLYVTVTNATGSSILRFNNAFTATGNVAPAGSLSGSATTLNNPGEIFLDTSNNRLYVANRGAASVVIYDSASTANGNIAPTRTVAGGSTALVAPQAVSVDTTKDLLYVVDSGNLLVFSGASTANGNVAPTTTAPLGFVATAIFDDATNDRLYIADAGGNSVGIYDNASAIPSGSVSASRTISGASTLLASPFGLLLDLTGRLIVSNSSGSGITIYSNAATASGNAIPAAAIAGAATTFVVPRQIALNSSGSGTLYVGDAVAGEVASFGSLSSANGNIAPTRNISGSNTGLSANSGALSVQGLALDTTR